MNWEAIGAASEIIGALAVVITLIFLVVEMRHGRKATEAASVDLLSAGWNVLNGHLMDDAELCSFFFAGLNDPDTLDAEQKTRVMIVGQSYINHFMTVKKYYDAGHLPEEEWNYHSAGISRLMNSPGGKWICDVAAVTPSVQDVFNGFIEDQYPDGYLNISNVGSS